MKPYTFQINALLIGTALLCLIVMGCQDNLSPFATYEELEVEVEFVEAVQSDRVEGEATIYGRLLKPQEGSISVLGFAIAFEPGIEYLSGGTNLIFPGDPYQVLVDTLFEDGTFRAALTDLPLEAPIYVQAFAANEYMHDLSEESSFELIPVGPPEVPCSTPDNRFEIVNGSGFPITSTSFRANGDAYVLTLNSGTNNRLSLDFNEPIRNGIYTLGTFQQFIDRNDERIIRGQFRFGFETYSIQPGAKVYVTKLNNGAFQVDFCRLAFTSASGDLQLIGNGVVN